MNKRSVIQTVIRGEKPPYVPWSFSFTHEALDRLKKHFGDSDLETVLQNHFAGMGNVYGFFEEIGEGCVRDRFGVVWDRSVDKDIGVVKGQVLPEASIAGYRFPDPCDERCFKDIPATMERYPDRYRIFSIGFSLYERAWSLRGMEPLLLDFYTNPGFVEELLGSIADHNIAQVRQAVQYDIDAVYFGDDWGMQRGLQMGIDLWRQFIKPQLARMYAAVHEAGKAVFIHSCGDVDELFDELAEIGVNCFNPFQPEVMDVHEMIDRYRGRLTFHGGLSTQRTLPYGSVEDVRSETASLIEKGRDGSYILSPAHAVEGDVSIENMLAFIEVAQAQPQAPKSPLVITS